VFGINSSRNRHRIALGALVSVALVASTAGCAASGSGSSGDKVTITLSGPNQWNNSSDSFGKPWDKLVSDFEAAEPNITVKTTVLPATSWVDTLSTQLSAGTAPNLVFQQAPHTPDQVVVLDKYLQEPNPFIPGNTHWIDNFNSAHFGTGNERSLDANGHYSYVPFNLTSLGIYRNDTLLKKAGVTGDIETFDDLMSACTKIKDAGFSPMAMDSGTNAADWTFWSLGSMLLRKYADKINVFDSAGNPGTAPQVTQKGLAKAVLTGELSVTGTPEVKDMLKLEKQLYDTCATPNWSGIAAGSAGDEFSGGKAAFMFSTSFYSSYLESVDFKYSTMPFPTVEKSNSQYADGSLAQFGASDGGTSYMISSTTKGSQLDASIKFLQYVTSAKGGQAWLDGTGAIPSTLDAKTPAAAEGLLQGKWSETPPIKFFTKTPKAKSGQNAYEGYLIGSESLDAQAEQMQADTVAAWKEVATASGWTDDWAK
jgi:ABC-type glycerol-3-phosphate transport system substrate-binding protein